MLGVNGVSFSYSAISTFQQNDDSGWKCSVSDIGTTPVQVSFCLTKTPFW